MRFDELPKLLSDHDQNLIQTSRHVKPGVTSMKS